MSCRILGRYLENWIYQEIVKLQKKLKKSKIIFEFKPTEKNVVTENFIKNIKLKKIQQNELKKLKSLNNFQINKKSVYYENDKYFKNQITSIYEDR